MFGRSVRRWSSYFVVLACSLVLGATLLLGQGTTGTITGVVTDQSGAVVPDAAVAVLNQNTGVDLHTKTNSAGVYSVTSLIPGRYSVTVAAKGFKTYVNRDLTMQVDETLRIDVQLEVGAETQTITVEGAAPLVNTEEGRLSAVVTASQVQNMPLNGRNIYQLMLLVPGAIDSTGVNKENASAGGISTNINGSRLNFNGFLLDGVANKSLTGGPNAQPAPDFVQEFRIMTNDFSAQYGNSAGSITDVSIKSGTNALHGSAWEYLRNDKLNARNFFDGDTRQIWRQNQFGASIGGPIKKDKLFFFAGYEGERFRTETPQLITTETPEWIQAVRGTVPNSVASVLYGSFKTPVPTENFSTVDDVVTATAADDVGAVLFDGTNFADAAYAFDDNGDPLNAVLTNYYQSYTDPCFLNQFNVIGSPGYSGGPNWGDAQLTANRFGSLLGVTQAEHDQIQSNINNVPACAGFVAPPVGTGAILRTANMLGLANAKFASRASGVFYNGDQFTGRIDYQGDKSRIFGRFIHFLKKDTNASTNTGAFRGFAVPATSSFPSAAFGFVYSFSPTLVNEFRAGYTRNQLSDIPDPKSFGVPDIEFDNGGAYFGAYNGYPQFFIENVYNYSDMLAIIKGKHSIKAGGEYKRNLENSEFNVGRPSYLFFDQLYFAAGLPYWEAAGVNPELTSGNPSHIDTNIRAWRNYELGFFVQDDWKVSKRLTLNFGLRWDYYSPHTEKYGHVTQFTYGPGANPTERLASIVCEASIAGKCLEPRGDTQTPNGGFSPASRLFNPDRNNFSPRFGFAWDPFGNGKTSIRGGFAIFYEATIYNPLSNSRWNLPYYSFNRAAPLLGISGVPVFGPTNPDGTPSGATPRFDGPPDNPGQGPAGLGFAGNIMGWFPNSPDLAYLTGVLDANTRTPYMENGFFGFQQEITPSTVLEVNWVGTFGKKLIWGENPNRVVGQRKSSISVYNPCTGGFQRRTGAVNPCFGILRTFKNSVTSNYNALQVTLTKKASRGLAFTSAYTWSHSLDFRSSWHASTSGGSADWANAVGSSGYSQDPTRVYLEYGNSGFDVRQRWATSIVWEMPWLKDQHGAVGKTFGGWQMNGILTFQSGLPFTVGANVDYNLDGIRSDRPDTPVRGNHFPFSNKDFLLGSGKGGNSYFQDLAGTFPTPASGTTGNLGRNTFQGPGTAVFDFSLFKTIPFNERFNLQFRAEFFNITNRVNLYQPVANLSDASFGISQQAFDPRVIQFGLRLAF